jgi:D-tyrosyl-tRNA(Tyr) deacylase
VRVLVQLVSKASVTIDNKVYSSIGKGYLLLVGFTEGDNVETMTKMADKIMKLRVFPDENGKTNKSIFDVGGEVLSVSQFTLYASLLEGNRPSFIEAMRPEKASVLYKLWNNLLLERFKSVKTGVFGADMKVDLINDGPFTLWLDSKELFKK